MSFQEALDWYVHLAKEPGWKAYVWHRVKEMALKHPCLFRDLPEEFLKVVRKGKDEGK